MDRLKQIGISIGVGVLVVALGIVLESDYLQKFIETNLIVIIAALLAINTTTTSIIASKLRDLQDGTGVDLYEMRGELRISLIEQIVFVWLSVLCLVVRESDVVVAEARWVHSVTDVLLAAIFYLAIYNTYDTSRGMFDLINVQGELTKSKRSDPRGDTPTDYTP